MSPEDAFGLALRYNGGQAFHEWLRRVAYIGPQDGASFRWPLGLNRMPADAASCIDAAEALGLVQWTGAFTCDQSRRFFSRATYGGRNPEKRDPLWVTSDEKVWEAGPRADLLVIVADTPWSEIEACSAVRKKVRGGG